jgi:hypothetical protein
MAAHLHSCGRNAAGGIGVGGDLVTNEEERRLGALITQDLEQPVGERAWAVVECQSDALVFCAIDFVGVHFALSTRRVHHQGADDRDHRDKCTHLPPQPAAPLHRHPFRRLVPSTERDRRC